MKTIFLLAFILAGVLFLTSCATTHVMKDCEQVNGGTYFFCKRQYKVWN